MGEPDTPRTPAVDERLVMPQARAEIVRGALVMTPPADEPHGTSHFGLAYVLRAHVADGYLGAVDMLESRRVLEWVRETDSITCRSSAPTRSSA